MPDCFCCGIVKVSKYFFGFIFIMEGRIMSDNSKRLNEEFINGINSFENNDFNKGIKIFNKLLLNDYEVDMILPYIIKYYQMKNDSSKISYYLNFLDDNSDDIELLSLKALFLLKKSDYENSLRIIDNILENDPFNEEILMMKLAALKNLGKYNEIKDIINEYNLDLEFYEENNQPDNISIQEQNSESNIENNDLNFINAAELNRNGDLTNINSEADKSGFSLKELEKDVKDTDLIFITADKLNNKNLSDTESGVFENEEQEDNSFDNILSDFASSINSKIYMDDKSDDGFDLSGDEFNDDLYVEGEDFPENIDAFVYNDSSDTMNQNNEFSLDEFNISDNNTDNLANSSDINIGLRSSDTNINNKFYINNRINQVNEENSINSSDNNHDMNNRDMFANSMPEKTLEKQEKNSFRYTSEANDNIIRGKTRDINDTGCIINEVYGEDDDLVNVYSNENNEESLFTYEINEIDLPLLTKNYKEEFNKKQNSSLNKENNLDLDSLFNFDSDGNLIDDNPEDFTDKEKPMENSNNSKDNKNNIFGDNVSYSDNNPSEYMESSDNNSDVRTEPSDYFENSSKIRNKNSKISNLRKTTLDSFFNFNYSK